jgi:hypothetical protein
MYVKSHNLLLEGQMCADLKQLFYIRDDGTWSADSRSVFKGRLPNLPVFSLILFNIRGGQLFQRTRQAKLDNPMEESKEF